MCKEGPSWKGQNAKRGLRGKVKSEEPSWKGQINIRDRRVIHNGNPGQIPGLIYHRIIKRTERHMHVNIKLFMIFIISGDICW